MKYALAALIAIGALIGVAAQAAPVSHDVAPVAGSEATKVDWDSWHNRWRSHRRWGSYGGWHNRWRSHHRQGSAGGYDHNRWRSHHRRGSRY